MRNLNRIIASRICLVFAVLIVPTTLRADWSLNLGYNNPPGAQIGVNFMRLWTNVAFEAGIGWVNASSNKSTDNKQLSNRNAGEEGSNSDGAVNLAVSGAMSLKYLFLSGVIRPYLQAGMGTGVSAIVGSKNSAGAGVGGGWAGAGLFIIGKPITVYGSYNVSPNASFVQAGLGFPL